uniref:Uncharacterized protein n=1 Tax=Oryza sativa subsp. japonica TaxID=39947 RepID=Q6ZK00_ORYSJ|nr:hypothetical protein [Oryza sativa Japonica Group]
MTSVIRVNNSTNQRIKFGVHIYYAYEELLREDDGGGGGGGDDEVTGMASRRRGGAGKHGEEGKAG